MTRATVKTTVKSAVQRRANELKPFFSILLVITTLFSVVFLKMEVRRMGYEVLKVTQDYRTLRDRYRMLEMEYVRVTRSEHIRKYAMAKLTLNDARSGQIIQLTGRKIALPQ